MYDGSSSPTQEFPRITEPSPPAVDPDATAELPVVNAAPQPTHMHAQTHPQYRPQAGGPPGWFTRLGYKVAAAPRWVFPAAVLVAFAACAAGVLVTNPTDNVGPSTCAFKMVTGFACPGCGGTRAFYYVLTMNLPDAAQHHAIAVFAAPFLVYMYTRWSWRRIFPRVKWQLPKLPLTPAIGTYFMIAWGAFWVIRNIPVAPFTALYV
ncbi:MAG TPA: DUF2752 domain-containing protein [Candidatus Stackebrandtia faecavium]|nr:DUF2752 domain-containing protein [Candidatus Stackebrandtia faecavium]